METYITITLAAFAIALWTYIQEAKEKSSGSRQALQPVRLDDEENRKLRKKS